jgi:DNA-binding LacI/PurR family transcriptional regulator
MLHGPTNSSILFPSSKIVNIRPTQLKYQRVEAEIRQFAQTLPLGAKLPAERDLAISYDCNFLTVRKALKRLVDDGTIVRRVGSGTFIAKHPLENGAGSTQEEDKIGILVYQNSNPYAYRVLQSIAHASIDLNVDLSSIWVRDFGDEALAQVNLLKKDRCVALTLPWFPHEKVDEVRRFVNRCVLPVSLPLVIPGLEKNCFEQEDIFGASSTTMTIEDSCRYYKALGYERIALIGPDSANDLILQRKISGYVHYTSRENMPSLCGLVGAGAQAMDQLAERWKAYRGNLAIISYDDEHALRFITAMHKIGLTAPKDYSIIGYNDTEGSRYSDPPLSTIHQNFDYIGHWLLKSAHALSQGKVCQSSRTPRLKMLVRDSCGGRDKINDAFCSQFEYIDIAVDPGPTQQEPLAIDATGESNGARSSVVAVSQASQAA